MRVKVDETGRDDETGGVEDFRGVVLGDSSSLCDFRDFVAVEKNVARSVGLGGWVDDAAVLNEKHARDPFLHRWKAVPRAPAFRQRDAPLRPSHPQEARRAAPCARRSRW